jgi:hypothetical protein
MKLTGKLLIAFVVMCFAVGDAQAQPDKLRVLFVGNSLTYSNDVPAIVAAIASATKQKKFEYKTVAYPDFGLEDHWTQGEARKEIAKGKWNFVVLQQGPSALPESRVVLRDYVRKFADEIRKVGATPAVYMVWPAIARKGDFDRVVESYRLAAEDVDAVLLPSGAAWLAALKTDPSLPLYSSDNFHPSELGSLLAAWVIFKRLYPDATVSLPEKLTVRAKPEFTLRLNPTQRNTLSSAAKDVAPMIGVSTTTR